MNHKASKLLFSNTLAIACLLGGTFSSFADLTAWEKATLGSSPATRVFTTTSGASPVLVNVGPLSGTESFEFIYNAGVGGASESLLGSGLASSGQQALKLDQFPNTGMFGVTAYGVADYASTVPSLWNQNVDIVFTSDGANTSMYLNGSFAYQFTGVALAITGVNGLGATASFNGPFADNLAGNILGFASYGKVLSPAVISAHYQAFVAPVPEPSLAAMTGLAGLAAVWLRRKQAF